MTFKKPLFSLYICLFVMTFKVYSQAKIYPSSPEFNLSYLKAFKADYDQMGMTVHVMTLLETNGVNYNISMIMPDITDPDKIITDVIGMNKKTGSFKYRNFHLLRPSISYNQVEKKGDTLFMKNLQNKELDIKKLKTKESYFDGTFIYWLLHGVIDSKIKSFKMNTWKYTSKGLKVELSPTFEMKGVGTINVSGMEFECTKIVVEPSPGIQLNSYISKSAPYLIKQEYVQGTSDPVAILQLKKLYK